MKLTLPPKLLKYLVLASGVAGVVLRGVLYGTGTDEKGLLVSGHWAETAIWALTVLVALAVLFFTRNLSGPEEYADCHRPSGGAALGCLATAGALALTAFGDLTEGTGAMPPVASFLALAGAGCLVAVAYCRLVGEKPPFLLHVVFCLALALRMLCLYRYWQSDPQLQDYGFYLGAYVTLMLAAYHHAAFDCGMGNHRSLWRFSLGAVYLCCLSIQGSRAPFLLLASAAWAWTNLTSLTPRKRRKRPELKL